MAEIVAQAASRGAENPYARPAGACVFVIFGATGDLMKRKLIPAVHNLLTGKLLPEEFAIAGLATGDLDSEGFRQRVREDLNTFATEPVTPEQWTWLSERLYFLGGDFRDPALYEALRAKLGEIDAEHHTAGNYLFYLATNPTLFCEVIERLGAAGLTAEDGAHWRRVVIEKPFGHDLDSARTLNREIARSLNEKQIYRIDHYLGKETVQNLLVFRFSNGIFEPIWNRRYIDSVQITAAETVGVEQRGGYYEEAGALRDMLPSHLFQLLALTAMEPPNSFGADAVRDEKGKLLRAVQPMLQEDVLTRAVRGQYGEGEIGGKRVPAYRSEPNVNPQSGTETFVAVKLLIDNWRWADVPFYLRTGKRMARRMTEIVIQFRRAPLLLFRKTDTQRLAPNLLTIQIQPDEGISLQFGAKVPGSTVQVGNVAMNFKYVDYFGDKPNTGYETMLYDAMIGDATLFTRFEGVESGWRIVQPLLDVWKALPPRSFPNYAAGTWGPGEADELLARDGRRWYNHDRTLGH